MYGRCKRKVIFHKFRKENNVSYRFPNKEDYIPKKEDYIPNKEDYIPKNDDGQKIRLDLKNCWFAVIRP